MLQATLAQHYIEVKSGLDQMQNQLALLQERDLDKMVANLTLMRVDQTPKGETSPRNIVK